MRLFVGNLPYELTAADLEKALAAYNPQNIDMVRDKLTGRFRGYAFADLDRRPTGEITIGIRKVFFGDAKKSD